jgi:small subunit ribosomal protein S17
MESKKLLTGVVVSTKMNKTVIVAVTHLTHHMKYKKTIKRTRHYAAHNELPDIETGMKVSIESIRPMSKTKYFQVVGKITG